MTDEETLHDWDGDDGGYGLSLCTAFLQEAINDYLVSGPSEGPESKLSLATCSCEPLCPIDAYWRHGVDLGYSTAARCPRMRDLRNIGEYPAYAWLTSRSPEPWSFHWICGQFSVDPDWLREVIMKLPKGEPLKVNGKRLYRQSRASYDTRSQELRRKFLTDEDGPDEDLTTIETAELVLPRHLRNTMRKDLLGLS